jgi:hypothetical protein
MKSFFDALQKFTTWKVEGKRLADKIVVYDCKHAVSVADVIADLLSNVDTHVLVAKNPKTFVLFAYWTLGDPVLVNKTNVSLIARAAKHVVADDVRQKDFIDNKDEGAEKPPKIPRPMLFIGNMNLQESRNRCVKHKGYILGNAYRLLHSFRLRKVQEVRPKRSSPCNSVAFLSKA